MLRIDPDSGRMWDADNAVVFADQPYAYSIVGAVAGKEPTNASFCLQDVKTQGADVVITGVFSELNISVRHHLHTSTAGVEERVTLKNLHSEPVTLSDIGFGFAAELGTRPEWRLCAIPFRTQLDGSSHDYTTAELLSGDIANATYDDPSQVDRPLVTEPDRVRSEAWAWGQGRSGLLIIKYNNADIELSVAAPFTTDAGTALRFGGVGTCLYREPSRGHHLAPGDAFTFGTTHYIYFEGAVEHAFYRYRDFLDTRGHGFPADYDPPVNWNELYDIGWYHSDATQLKEQYTRDALIREAAKAKECSCEMLYLDPGWEEAEGTSLWDEARLGSPADLVRTMKEDWDLQLGFRTILRCYADHWPLCHVVKHADIQKEALQWGNQPRWELCMCDPSFREEKLERILKICKDGMRFLMVDEMDWRGPCHDPEHGHAVPSTPLEHVQAVYSFCRELRKQCPDLIIECHDPVWPWRTSLYVPTYFQQGFGEHGAYDENWGFEYMWYCIDDLKSGKALALYHYNMGCNIPLYLHITMAADNDNCLFFWWAASTVRHLGIGGKHSHPSVEPERPLAPHDPEARYDAYRAQMKTYQSLKPYLVRGTFHGIAENMHLHTLPDREGGVLLMFNLTDTEQTLTAEIPRSMLQSGQDLTVVGAESEYTDDMLTVRSRTPALTPVVVRIGDTTG